MTVLLSLYALFVLALTVAEYRGDRRAQYLFKPACALGFILIALMSGALETLYGQIILAGLAACAIGDVLLLRRGAEKLFLLGMAAFALGHILFAHAFYMAHSHDAAFVYEGIAGFILAIICAFSALQICKSAAPAMRAPVVIYTVIIWSMVVLAIFTKAPNLILGACLFAVSDIFVGRDRFIAPKPWHALAITPLYFGAQALFALSVANAL